MLFTIAAVICFLLGLVVAAVALGMFFDKDKVPGVALFIVGLLLLASGTWFQTHRIVSTQYVGISKATLSQELSGPYPSGLVSKPFLGAVYELPSSSRYERCEKYTPAIKGSYGITVDLCYYYDAGSVDWLVEVNRTGSLDANYIMSVWRNSVVGDVARSVKEYTPEALSDNRSEVEASIYENVLPWFTERGIGLTGVSFKNWDFTSAEVASSFDASIVSQRKIAEQSSLLEAAKISRERESYEAETSKLVAEWQKEALDELGLEGQSAIDYLWIKLMTEQQKTPDVLILGTSGVPVTVPLAGEGQVK